MKEPYILELRLLLRSKDPNDHLFVNREYTVAAGDLVEVLKILADLEAYAK